MKKWLLLLAALLVIFLSCVYIFIPATINVSNIITVKAHQKANGENGGTIGHMKKKIQNQVLYLIMANMIIV
jgi:hypothetical protein